MKEREHFAGARTLLLVLICSICVTPLVPSNAVGAQDETGYTGPRITSEKPSQALEVLEQVETGLNYAARKARPAVVTIFVERTVRRRRGFPFRFNLPRSPQRKRSVQGLGSGVIIRSNGYIVTNHHVVEDVNDIKVLLPSQEKVSASVVGTDPRTDLAVLKVDRRKLPELDFADSSQLKVGQWAIAVGSPFSLENSVSYGHVSALQRSIQATEYENFVQTDAPINRGNSGGPLVNIHGEIIGINTIIQSTSGGSQGVGFASASNLVKRTVRDIIEHGEVRRAWLGVSIQKLPPEALKEHFGKERGALVAEAHQKSPADSAGIQGGDLITALNGEKIDNPSELQQTVIAHDPGESVDVTLHRDGQRRTLTVELGKRPSAQSKSSADPPSRENLLAKLGVGAKTFEPVQARQAGLDVKRPVVQVARLGRGSPAQQAGLRPGDLILSANRERITSAQSLQEKLLSLRESGRDSVLLSVHRKERRLFVTIPLPSPSSGQ